MKTKYIFVDFNAWQYVGSDVLWAGIILNLAKGVEKEFGAFCVRLFRLFQVRQLYVYVMLWQIGRWPGTST